MSVPVDDVRCDAAALAAQIESLVKDRLGMSMTLTRRALAAIIRRYAEDRCWAGPYDVRIFEPGDLFVPDDWSTHDEDVWQWWLNDKVTPEVWSSVVTGPVFGTDIRVWERNGTEWREELLSYLPMWVVRSTAIVSRVDPLPRPEEEAEIDGLVEEVDPYLVDQAGKGGRRRR
jgi:hypothetical protein